MHVFSRKSQKCVILMVKMEEISGLETNIGSFQQIFGQIFAFPTTRH